MELSFPIFGRLLSLERIWISKLLIVIGSPRWVYVIPSLENPLVYDLPLNNIYPR